MKLLFVEDDADLAATLKTELKDYYVVEIAATGEQAEYLTQVNEYDVIIIDYTLPDITGVEVCRKVRAVGIQTPIIMLTGNAEVGNKIAAFKQGVDDYVVKPFSIEELRLRIEALLRRSLHSQQNGVLSVDGVTLDLAKRLVTREGTPINLQRKELDLLEYLMRNAGKVVSRAMILDHIWDSSRESMTNVVDVHIKYLRDRLDRNFKKKLIKTVHGYGYKIEA